ncbi:MAG: hypothetical protein C0448_03040 [Sphingobacteriaceae bacterium]|nr:hypothetical protein [Sphingobacteriaceae bacterium]
MICPIWVNTKGIDKETVSFRCLCWKVVFTAGVKVMDFMCCNLKYYCHFALKHRYKGFFQPNCYYICAFTKPS